MRLYESNSCACPIEALGSAAGFASPGLTATVAGNTTATFTATATDAAGNVSACSATSSYTEDSRAPQTTIVSGPRRRPGNARLASASTPTSPRRIRVRPGRCQVRAVQLAAAVSAGKAGVLTSSWSRHRPGQQRPDAGAANMEGHPGSPAGSADSLGVAQREDMLTLSP